MCEGIKINVKLSFQDKHISELKKMMKRYKRIEEMILSSQGKKGTLCHCVMFSCVYILTLIKALDV